MIKSGHSDRDVTIHLIDSGTGNKMSSIFWVKLAGLMFLETVSAW